jgi:predicted secreted protein
MGRMTAKVSFVKSLPLLSFLVAIALQCAACDDLRASDSSSETISVGGRAIHVLELKGIESPISLRVTQQIAIRTDALKSAGFLWSARSDNDAVSVSDVSIPHAPDKSPIVGAPERQYFLLRAEHRGSSTIEFRYGRPFEPGKVSDKSSVIVRVE